MCYIDGQKNKYSGINYTHIHRHKWHIFVKICMTVIPMKISQHVSLIINKNKLLHTGQKAFAIRFKVYKCRMEKVTALEN
jgi:hypothetical protein